MATIRIFRDEFPENPREWSNLGTMIAFHKRYSLGDDNHGFHSSDYSGWSAMEAAILAEHKGGIILPLYLYDHGGITMSTTPFSCPWDSGQVGFIVASAEKIRQVYMVKRITKKIRERAIKSLVREVEVYDNYLTGEVYGFEIISPSGHVAESCSGFYGNDPFKNGMSDNITPSLHEALRNAL